MVGLPPDTRREHQEYDLDFPDFHIHMATERYQEIGYEKEDAYAEITDRYGDFSGALECLIEDAGIPPDPPDPQLRLFR